MPRNRLSERQQDILDFCGEYIDDHGYPPSIRDIQNGLVISSTSVVDYNLKRLEENGEIRRDRDTARSIEILGRVRAAVQSLPYAGLLAPRAPLAAPTAETVDVIHPQREQSFPEHAIGARATAGFEASLVAEGDLLVLDPKPTDEEALLVVWSDTRAETLIGHIRDAMLRRGPFYDPIGIGNWEPQAEVLAVFRSY